MTSAINSSSIVRSGMLEDRIAYMKIDKKLFSDEDFDSLLGRHSYTG